MRDLPDTRQPQPGNPREPETARKPSAILRYRETDWYIFHIAVFTTAGAITMVLIHVMNPVGSPLETFRSILVNVGHVSGMSIAYTVALALVSKTVRFVHRRFAATVVQVPPRIAMPVTRRPHQGCRSPAKFP